MTFHFFIGKLERATFGSQDKAKIVNRLVDYALKRGFRTFRNPEFRRKVQFSELAQVEQDRMFNELVASNIVLVLLMIDTFAKLAERGVQEYLRTLCNHISTQFAEKLHKMGIAERNVKTWIKLLDLRHDEYEEERMRAQFFAGIWPRQSVGTRCSDRVFISYPSWKGNCQGSVISAAYER